MVAFVNAKKATNLLDDKAKARLVKCFSGSSSNYSSSSTDDEFPCLSQLVHSFLTDTETTESISSEFSDSDRIDSSSESTEKLLNKYINSNNVDPYKNVLSLHVTKAVQALSHMALNDCNKKSLCMSKVTSFLRDLGHNAAICKTKWDTSGGVTAGSYEFIDVIHTSSASCNTGTRYYVDIEFAAEFEIARPTERYTRILRILPRVFVGKSEELKKIVKLMSDEAKRSMKCRELSLPPWRKNRFMQNKWFGPNRRNVSLVQVGPSTVVNAVSCRSVGFSNGVSSRLSVRT